MATTGFDFDKLWQRRVDKTYNSYYSTPQREKLYKQALYYAVEDQYNNLIVQGQYDEIRDLIKINVALTPVNDTIIIDTGLPDYLHYLFSRAKYELGQYAFAGFTYSGTGAIRAYVTQVCALRTGSFVVNAGCEEMNEANGSFYLKAVGRLAYDLYLNEALTQPATATVFTGGPATATMYEYGKCMVQYSDQRIQVLDSPTKRNPKVMIADNSIKIEPAGCSELVLDYVTNPPVFIDPTNTTINLEEYYPMKFLYQIIDKAAQIFDVETKDPQSFQQDMTLEKTNS